MPILCDPNSTFDVVLDSDADKTPTPTFVARCQSLRGQMQICATIDKLAEQKTSTAELFTETIERLAAVFVGWRNMPEEYEPSKLGDYLNYAEARQLLRKVLYHSQVSSVEKKS